MATVRRAKKHTTFTWEGFDNKGKKTSGEAEGSSIAYIKAILRRQGVRPTKVRKKPKPLLAFKKKVKTADITFMSRQLATLLSAGIPVVQALSAIGRGHENVAMQEMMGVIRNEVESGTSLSQSLGKYPLHFDRLYLSLVEAGEQSGKLDDLLGKVAIYLEKIEAIKSKIKSALFYPSAIVVVAILVVALLMLFVIPQFESLFKGFGADLPTLTQMIVNLSRWFQDWWWLFFGVLIGSVIFVSATYKRSEKMQYTTDRLLLHMPVFGPVVRKATIARFARTLATMFGAGVPLVDSLGSVANATGNRVYQNAILDIKSEVSTGRSLEATMTQTKLFPNMVLQMISTGEESGELETMLNKIADFYEREVDDAVAALSSLIEPFMIAFLGVVVGTIVVAMYLPIFKMAAVF
ncbi:MAG TPA: type II secretion system F family protein [Gammaproteobacteria bacterium]|nr:type II secretion system F family protein [Gammaproteobacteria bacterium]